MRIGEVSRITGVSPRALRYYEEQGLLVSVRRANGYRDYGPEAPGTVAFIQDLFRAGLGSELVRDVLACTNGGGEADCDDLVERARAARDDLARQEQRLAERRRRLDDYLAGVS